MEFVGESEIGSLWHDTFFIQTTQNANVIPARLNEIDGGLQVQSKIEVVPLYVFSGIFFLFKNKHVVIEKLLKLLVRVVD